MSCHLCHSDQRIPRDNKINKTGEKADLHYAKWTNMLNEAFQTCKPTSFEQTVIFLHVLFVYMRYESFYGNGNKLKIKETQGLIYAIFQRGAFLLTLIPLPYLWKINISRSHKTPAWLSMNMWSKCHSCIILITICFISQQQHRKVVGVHMLTGRADVHCYTKLGNYE